MELRFTAGIDRNQFKSDIDAMRRDILGLNNTVKSETSKMDSAFKNLSLGIAGYFSVNAVQGFVRELINVRGEFQKTEIAFTTMLGNADQAKSLMADMVELAAKTPFSLQDVSSGAKQLLAFQVPANEVVDTLTRLGNIAAGLSVPLSRINLVYGQVKAKGKLMGDDLRQFTEAGIPMVAELAKKFGTTTSEITAMVSAGKIGFKDVQDVLFSMTNEGGMFFNLMEKQSKSLSGQIANLGDAWDQMLNKIGEANDGILSDGIQGLTYLVQHYEDVIQVVGTLVATYGAYRAALIAANALNKASILIESTQAAIRFAQGISGMTKAQLLFNVAASANPYVLIAAGIAAVVGALVYYKTGTKEASEATEKLNAQLQLNKEINETTTKEFSNSSAKKLSAINKEIAVLKSEYSTLEMRKAAYNSLISLNSSFIGTVDKEFRAVSSLTSVYNSLVRSLSEVALAKGKAKVFEQLGEELAKTQLEKMLAGDSLNKAKKTNKVTTQTYYQNYGGAGVSARSASPTIITTNSNQKQIDESTKMLKDASKKEQEVNKKLQLLGEDRVKAITILQAQIRGGIENGRKLSKQEIEAKKEALKFYKGASNEEVATINNSTENLKNANDKNNAEVEKIFGEDTIKGLQQRISKLQEIIETSVIGSDAYNKAFSDKEKFEKRLKEIQVQSFDEQITELKRQFSVRDKLLEQGYSKETVDGMFPEIKDKNLLQSMQEISDGLDKVFKAGEGNKATTDNLININEQIRVMLGQKSALEDFSKNLDLGRNGKSSSEYIDFLNYQKTTGGSELDLAKNAEIQKRIDAEIEAQKQRYQEFLAAHQSFEEKKNAITENYAKLREKIEADPNLNNEQKKNALEKAGQEEADAYSDAFMTELVNNPQYREAFADLDRQTTSQLKKIRDNLKKDLAKNGENLNPEAQARIRQEIENLDRVIGERNPYQKLKNLIEQLGDESVSTSQKMKLINEAADTVTGYVNDVKGIVSDVTGALDDLGIEMSDSTKDTLDNINQTLDGLSKMSEGTKEFAQGFFTGDPMKMVTGTVKYISGAIKAISAWTNGDKKKERQIKAWANEVANLKVQYQELERAMNKALGDDKYKTQQQEIANLEKQKILLQKMIKKEEDKKKTDKGKIKDWQQQISDINAQIDDLKKSIVDDILQIDVKGLADKIGDALIEGFGRGEDALESLNKTADEVFKDMVKNALNMQLEKQMQPIVDDMLKAMGYSVDSSGTPSGSFDVLTPEEQEAIKAQIIAATEDYQKAMEQYADLFGPDAANSPNGLEGDIKGITEKTAGALESQINAIRIYQVEALNISKRNQQIFLDALKHQAEIAYNTRPLFQIQKDIAELNSKVKKPLAGLNN